MLRVTLRNLLARKVRLFMSAFAIVLGVAFVAGSFVFTDTLSASFDQIVKGSTGDVVVEVEGASDPGDPTDPGDTRVIPADVVDGLADVSGAARVDGNVGVGSVFVLGSDGKLIGGNGPPSLGLNYNDAPAITGEPALRLVEGRPPQGGDEVVLDVDTARRGGYDLGDSVSLVTSTDEPQLSAELVGLAEFGDGSLLGATLSIFDTDTMQQLFLGGRDAYTDAWVTAADGVSQTELRDQVAELLPTGVVARTGDAVAQEDQDDIGQALSFITTFLLVFAGVALVVGSFLIVNTFSILVAQRSRELALLRALGATRRQVTRSVLLEAFVVGLIGATVGLGLGFALAVGLKALFGVIGLELTGSGLVFSARTAVVAYAVGLVVTMVAAYLPARRSARIPPVAAMRDDIALPEQSVRRRSLAGAFLVLVGAGLATAGLLGSGTSGASLVGGGILGVLIGVALLAPLLGRPLLRLLEAGYRRIWGTVGVLAGQNALRNPRRTAATASALMVGLALVTTMAILGSSTNASLDKLIGDSYRSDYVISNAVGAPFSPAIARRAAEVDGVSSVTSVRAAPASIDGADQFLAGVEPATLPDAIDLEVPTGSLADLDDGSALLEQDTARDLGVSVGDTVTVHVGTGPQRLEVAGTFVATPLIFATVMVTQDALADAGVRPADQAVFAQRDPEAPLDAVRAGLDEVIAGLPTVTLQDQQEFRDAQAGQVNTLLYLVYALLGLALVIAVLGIVNTLALSVIERTREVGLLRAVGLSRRQLRRMVRLESVAIAVLGAALGIVMGLVFGVVLQRAVADQGIDVLAVPWWSLVLFVVVAALVGVLAAVFPARRAARQDVLRAISTE